MIQSHADQATLDDERSWELFERQRQEREAADAAARAELADALVQLDCIDCGTAIPSERLRLCPRTRRCTRCASSLEG